METNQSKVAQSSSRIHPMIAGAAASVMLVSLVGVAAITGILPSSHSTIASVASAEQVGVGVTPTPTAAALAAPSAKDAVAPVAKTSVTHKNQVKQAVHHADPVYSKAAPTAQYAQASSQYGQTYQQPVQQQYQQPVQQPSPVGIAAGAVIGGLLGNQVGGGNGRTLATVAGAVGGGYVGNEVGKKYGY